MKRVLSGIKPTGDPTLGNYIGAMKRWGEMAQDSKHEHFFFVPNLHALNMRPNPDELRRLNRAVVAWLVAVGADQPTSYIFLQSAVPAHAELTWVLNNYTTMGELNRMTQFKDKAQKLGPDGQLVALYDYPVLMAADILLYDTEEVPVGEDQKQHVELTRDIATRFNNLHGPIFTVPKPVLPVEGARIMDLQDPTKKMSKSEGDLSGCILLMDEPDVITRKITRAVTDSGSSVAMADDKPAVSNLLVIYSVLSGLETAALEERYAGKGYGDFKRDLAELVVEKLRPLQEHYARLIEPGNNEVDKVLERGRQHAVDIATAKLNSVYTALGLS
jgi:tryptophanyl-tRNA synthetase